MTDARPLYYDDDPEVPFCTDTCPEHDGKRCSILGRRPGELCLPMVKAMGKKLEARRTSTDEELIKVANLIQLCFKQAGDYIERFRALGGQFNLRVYHNGGCESIDLHQLNGEFEGEYLKTEKIDVAD